MLRVVEDKYKTRRHEKQRPPDVGLVTPPYHESSHFDTAMTGQGAKGQRARRTRGKQTPNAATLAKFLEGSYYAEEVRGEEDRAPSSGAVKIKPEGRNRLPSASNSPLRY